MLSKVFTNKMIAFTCKGHKNILATHKTTLELIKDKEVTEKGDCIVGVDCNFDVEELKSFIKKLSLEKKVLSKKVIRLRPDKFPNEYRRCEFEMYKESFIKENKLKIILECDGIKEEIIGEVNKDFNSEKEIVIRLGDFKSERTLLINANKSAKYLSEEFKNKLKEGKIINVNIVNFIKY